MDLERTKEFDIEAVTEKDTTTKEADKSDAEVTQETVATLSNRKAVQYLQDSMSIMVGPKPDLNEGIELPPSQNELRKRKDNSGKEGGEVDSPIGKGGRDLEALQNGGDDADLIELENALGPGQPEVPLVDLQAMENTNLKSNGAAEGVIPEHDPESKLNILEGDTGVEENDLSSELAPKDQKRRKRQLEMDNLENLIHNRNAEDDKRKEPDTIESLLHSHRVIGQRPEFEQGLSRAGKSSDGADLSRKGDLAGILGGHKSHLLGGKGW